MLVNILIIIITKANMKLLVTINTRYAMCYMDIPKSNIVILLLL